MGGRNANPRFSELFQRVLLSYQGYQQKTDQISVKEANCPAGYDGRDKNMGRHIDEKHIGKCKHHSEYDMSDDAWNKSGLHFFCEEATDGSYHIRVGGTGVMDGPHYGRHTDGPEKARH